MHRIGVDWGSSNRRAYLLDGAGMLLDKREDGQGALSLARAEFAASLHEWLHDWLALPGRRVWLTGMVGSRQGWQEAPYLAAPAALAGLAGAPVPLTGEMACRIMPGVSQQSPAGQADVMRGEETQLLGAWSMDRRDGWYVLPGTHSKWVRVEGGAIRQFRTFLTGELFAQLRSSGSLAAMMAGEATLGPAFDAGLRRGYRNALLAELFSVRAGVLLGEWDAADAPSLLSGLLIGSEWAAAGAAGSVHDKPLGIIASPALAQRYAHAARLFEIPVTVLAPDDCYVAALRQFAGATA